MSYLQSLNEVQRQAVTQTDGPVMVIAGPGSGKTRVLTYRIAYLIQQGVVPHHILALTFTNKAAREMKERIATVVGPKGDRVWAGTFHSIFAKILRVEATKIG
ncbi:MAG: UvrD-helicase domain-containing protein, partial [Saprospiraceae bacterium]